MYCEAGRQEADGTEHPAARNPLNVRNRQRNIEASAYAPSLRWYAGFPAYGGAEAICEAQ